MKKGALMLCMLFLLLPFGACGNRSAAEEPSQTESGGAAALSLRVVCGAGTERLVLAGETRGEVYTAAAAQLTVYANGAEASPAELENGMLLTLDPGFTLLETYPVQLTGAVVRVQSGIGGREDHGDLCGLYLQVLEDLWEDDAGLNADIAFISVDLDGAPGQLTEGEKAAIAWVFASRHDAQGLQLGFKGLKDNGYIRDGFLYWEDGVLFSITAADRGKNSARELSFNAEKWRSGDGAIFFLDCTAKRGGGLQWEPYKAGSFAIS